MHTPSKIPLSPETRNELARWLIDRIEEKKQIDRLFDEAEFEVDSDCSNFGSCIHHSMHHVLDETCDEGQTVLYYAMLDLLDVSRQEILEAGKKFLDEAYGDSYTC